MASISALAVAADPQVRKLRVGVFADSPLQPRWAVEALTRLAASDFADVRLVESGATALARPSAPWRLYGALDRRLFGADPTDLMPIGAGMAKGGNGELDVAFALGAVDDARLDGIARYGVWRFCFGPDGAHSEALAGLSEVAAGEPLTASGIKIRVNNGVKLAYQSWSRTYPFSVARNRDQLLRKTAEFAWRSLRELHRSGDGWLSRCRELPHWTAPEHKPGIADLSRIVGRLAARGIDRALHIEQWILAYRFGGSLSADLGGFTRLVPPKDRDWADPFVIEKNGRYFVFFEELPYASGKAHISMIELDSAGNVSRPQKVLETDYHLSYPFVFEHDGQLYMIPESGRNRTVELYRCIDFPLAWRLERVLVDGLRLVDATLHKGTGNGSGADRWWMFANSAAGESRMFDDELHVFHADRLLGEWKPHPRNPVKSDARSARPAGRLFERDGALVRPAQICVPRYGAGLALQRVTRLTPHEYAERQIERLLPPPGSGLYGLHTLNRAGDLTVVDAFIRRRRI